MHTDQKDDNNNNKAIPPHPTTTTFTGNARSLFTQDLPLPNDWLAAASAKPISSRHRALAADGNEKGYGHGGGGGHGHQHGHHHDHSFPYGINPYHPPNPPAGGHYPPNKMADVPDYKPKSPVVRALEQILFKKAQDDQKNINHQFHFRGTSEKMMKKNKKN